MVSLLLNPRSTYQYTILAPDMIFTPKVLLLGHSWGACMPWRSQRLCQLEFWLLVGTTMLDRLWARGQTICNTAAGSNQMGCSCTWQRSLFRKTNTGATEEIPALNQSWRGCNHPTSDRPYKGHQVPYLVPRTTNYLSPLWSNTDHWPYAPGVCSVTGM